MSLAVSFSLKAKADLDEIWDYTCRRWSRDQANSYLTGLRRTLDLLAEQPQIARLRRDMIPPVRVHPYRSHLLVFTADDTMLEVIRVVHARSDWSALSGE